MKLRYDNRWVWETEDDELKACIGTGVRIGHGNTRGNQSMEASRLERRGLDTPSCKEGSTVPFMDGRFHLSDNDFSLRTLGSASASTS